MLVAMAMATTRPILPSADLDATADFYALLDFEARGRWPGYLILTGADGIELHFWHQPSVDRWTNDVACWVGYPEPDPVTRLHARWAAAPLPAPATLTTPSDAGSHLLEFQLIDLHGNLVRVGAPVADGAAGKAP